MPRYLLPLLLVLTSSALNADSLWLVQASSRGYLTPCEHVSWETDTIFFNRGTETASVSFSGTSNGPAEEPLQLTSFEIPPGRTASLMRMTGRSWAPRSNEPLWVTEVDVTGDVEVKDGLVIGTDPYSAGCARISGAPIENRGRTAYPVVRQLAPPNEVQVHLGTYLGAATPSRLNVGIYNGASVPANAAIYVRRDCDESVVASRFTTVPANAIVQIPVFSGFAPTERCPAFQSGRLGGALGGLYTVVTVDQPSFSYVANVIEGQAPIAGIVISPP
ncbi:MAG TPA: hypothetical protein VGF40_09630 [Thermoanaerobaculia bacterium]